MLKPSQRHFLGSAAGLGVAEVAAGRASAFGDGADTARKFRLGIVTYNIAASWDLPTILRVCRSVGLSPVELRTTHKHGVEPTLSKSERREVRQRFTDAGIEIWGCGTVCEFHSPEPGVVERNVEQCKKFTQLAADIGGRGVKVRPTASPPTCRLKKRWSRLAGR